MALAAPDSSVPPLIQRAWNGPWVWMALVGVLFCAPLFAGLDRQDLGNDEAIYAFSIQTMVRHGGWLTPKSIPNEEEAWLEKPPLKFWIVGLPIHWGLLPPDEFGLRFWDAVMGSLAFLYVFGIGRRLAGPVCGLAAVFLLFIHGPLVFDHGLRTNNMESALFLAYAGGMFHFLAWRSSGPDNRSHPVGVALYFVLGFMTKFVAVLFLPLVLAAAALLDREDRRRLWFSRRTLALAAIVAVSLAAPWFIYQAAVSGSRLYHVMFGMHVMQRLTATLDPRHLHPWHFYLSELWAALRANGTAWLTVIGAVLLIVDTVRRRWSSGALVLLWFIVPVAIISAGTSKLYHYAYPFLPPVAIAGGYAAARIARWLWLASGRVLEALGWARPGSLRNWNGRAALTPIAITIGSVALLIALATSLLGYVRIAVRNTVLIRNDSVIRPALIWVTAWAAGAPAYLLRTLLPLTALLLVLPTAGYWTVLNRALITDRPIHDVADCLSRVASARHAQGVALPGVLVEAAASSHGYSYYLHDLGIRDLRDDVPSGAIAAHLYVPASYGPVLLSPDRIARFQKEMPGNQQTRVGAFEHDGAMLLLPGPYAQCAPAR